MSMYMTNQAPLPEWRQSTGGTPSARGTATRGASSRGTTARMPTMPTLPSGAIGNLKSSMLNPTPSPTPPEPPQSPKVTQSPYLDSLFQEKNRKGQLSTLLGRDVTLPTEANRNARLAGLLA